MSGAAAPAPADGPAPVPSHGPRAVAEGGDAPARISFEAVGRGHLPLLRDWFSYPHVREWWGPPEEELAAVEADLDGNGFAMWIASLDGVPFAYVQDDDPARAEEPYYVGMPEGARAVDLLIGPPSQLGRGHAAPLLRAFAVHAEARGALGLLLDPDARNERAVRAYRRAEFREIRRHRDESGETIVFHLPLRGAA